MYCYLKFDRIFFSLNLSAHDFGVYSAGANMAEQVNSLGLMLVAVTAPAAVYVKQRGETDSAIGKFVIALAMVGISVAAGAYLFAPIIISYIFGQRYSDALSIFQTLMLITPLAYIDAASSVLIFKFERGNVFVLKTLAALVVAAILIAGLYPMLGWKAAVVGNGAALLVSLLINYSVYAKISKEIKCQRKLA
jgi:O-antigen/teichoic acid export membrane protein